ncbi:hypothetical protein LZ30DRAFT_606954 [Colletotrichum cereale]|nr:hypothetical protein LZ30DRAFT_606954 [Colletotrichum cereale]
MAVRPTGPGRRGVHFFAAQHDTDNSDRFITLPVFPQISQRPWKQENPSAYFFDFGMWMACKESRAVVTSRLSRRYNNGGDTRFRGLNVKLRHGQKGITFGIHHEDLICFQISDSSNIRPSYDFDFDAPSWRAMPQHIAFEYDVSWSFDSDDQYALCGMIHEKGPRGVFLSALDEVIRGDLPCHLYLIQYGAKVKPGTSTAMDHFYGDGLHNFYGDGLHLASAHEEDVEIECPSGAMNAWEFMNHVDDMGEWYWKGAVDDRGDCRCREYRCCCEVRANWHVTVLICEDV